MIAMANIAIFFFLLVLVYPAICALLALIAWHRKRRARGFENEARLIADIEKRTDRLKSLFFKISIVLIFFGIAPFLALWLVADK